MGRSIDLSFQQIADLPKNGHLSGYQSYNYLYNLYINHHSSTIYIPYIYIPYISLIRYLCEAMSRGPPLRCKGLEPDGSDEVWSADVIPKNLDEEVDEGVGG